MAGQGGEWRLSAQSSPTPKGSCAQQPPKITTTSIATISEHNYTMCIVIINEHPGCRCRWLQISSQCQPNAGFSQCPRFGKGRVAYEPEEFESLQCPIHTLYGYYDRNFVSQ